VNAARLATSERLQRTLRALREAGPRGMTTLELQRATGNLNPHSDVAEIEDDINKVGKTRYGISCVLERITGEGRRIHRYTLRIDPGANQEPPAPAPPIVTPDAYDDPDDGERTSFADAMAAMRRTVQETR
jgi:hypothetical protein